VAEDSSIERHLRVGQERLARIGEAVAAFRRLASADYGHFLATIEADLGTCPPELLGSSATPLLLGPADSTDAGADPRAATGSLREAVIALLANGSSRSTLEIRRELEARRPINRASLNSEIFTMRKLGLLRSEGKGRGTRHTIAARSTTTRASASKREPQARAAKRKRDDDEDHPAPARGAAPLDAERLYAAAIGGHHLLTKDEEWELARRLEEVEGALWERLLGGPLAAEARKLLLELDPPVDPTSASEARAADLDRLITSRVIAERAGQRPPDALADQRADLRVIAAEADRIRDRFATCNLRLVPSTIRRHGYHNATNLTMSDLIQEGNFGLLKAVSRFDYRRGLRFSTFATWWIRHYLVRARQNSGEVRVPVHLHDLASKVRRAKLDLRKKLGRDPDLGELATALKVSKKSLQTLEGDWLKYREALPVFDSVGDGEGETPSYLASDDPIADEILSQHEEDGRLALAITRIPTQLAQIVRRHFGLDGAEPETLFQIGDSMNLSRERIRQLEKKALIVLRQVLAEVTDAAA
jgi:RNA polymerase primary sigma factor